MKIVKSRPYQQKLRGHKQPVLKLYSPQGSDGTLLYSVSMGGELIVWDLEEKKIKNQFTLNASSKKEHSFEVRKICCAQFYNFILYTGLFDGSVYSWSIHTGQLIDVFCGHKEQINVIKKINNRVLITGGKDGKVNLWDTVSGSLDKSFVIQESITDTYYNQSKLTVIGNRKNIVVIDLQSNIVVKRKQTKIGRYITRLFEIKDQIMLQMSDYLLQCYKDICESPIWVVFTQNTWINSIKITGDYLMCGCQDATLRMLSLKKFEMIDTTKGHISSVNSLELSFGKIFTGGSDNYILEWDIEEFHHRLRERRMMAIEDLQSKKNDTYLKFMEKKKKKNAKKKHLSKSKSKTKTKTVSKSNK